MSIIPASRPSVNLTAYNPRDSWPSWTDSDRWEPGPDPDDTTDHTTPFEPSPDDEAGRLAILSEEECERDSALSDALAEYWVSERESEATLAAHHDLWDALSPNELIECRGHHSAMDFEI